MAGNLIGEPFEDYVNKQIKHRQKIQGKSERSLDEIQYLSNKNAWIKMASGVFLKDTRLDLLKKNDNSLITDANITTGKDLAINYVLFNGLSNFEGKKPLQRSGVKNLSNNPNPVYGVGGTKFGYSPMPGITDMEFRCLNRGSIKKATLNIKAHNREQFDIIDVLYLRLGYTVFIEWGWNKYYDSSGSLQPMEDTLIDSEWFNDKYDKSDYSEWLPKIEKRREETGGNYDGAFGTISNFSWDFQKDGSYDIKVEIMSLGSIAESLKINLDPVVKPNGGIDSARAQIKATISSLPQGEDGEIAFNKITNDQFNTIFPGVQEGIRKFIKFLKTDNNNTYFGGDNPLFKWYEDPKKGPNQLVPLTAILKGEILKVGTTGSPLDTILAVPSLIKLLSSDLYFNIGNMSGGNGKTSDNAKLLKEFFDIEALEGLKQQEFINNNIIKALLLSLNDMFIFNSGINRKYEAVGNLTEAEAYKKNAGLNLINKNNEVFSIQTANSASFEAVYNNFAFSTFYGHFYGGSSIIVEVANNQKFSNKQKAKLLFNNVDEAFIVSNVTGLLIELAKIDKNLQKEKEEETPETQVEND